MLHHPHRLSLAAGNQVPRSTETPRRARLCTAFQLICRIGQCHHLEHPRGRDAETGAGAIRTRIDMVLYTKCGLLQITYLPTYLPTYL